MKADIRTTIATMLANDETVCSSHLQAILAVCDDPFLMTDMQPVSSETDSFFNHTQAAEFLGVSDRTIWRYTSNGILPSVKIGSFRRYRRSDLVKLGDSATRNPPDGRPSTDAVVKGMTEE